MGPPLTASWRLLRRTTASIRSILGAGKPDTGLPSARFVRDAVESEFGIRASRIRAIHSRENGVWRIDSPQGVWVAKVCPPAESLQTVRRELRLYHWLSSRDVCVPRYRTRLQGGEVAELEINDKRNLLVLMHHEPLTHLRPDRCDRESIDSIGGEIARAHVILQNYPRATEFAAEPDGVGPWDAVHRPLGSFQSLQASPLAKSFRLSQMAAFQTIDRQVEEHLAEQRLPANLTRSVIHGDFYLANISLRPDGRAFLFDWEPILAPVAVDLAVLSMNLYTAQDISLARWETLRNWLLGSYTSRMTLADQDLRSIPLFTLRALMNLVRIYSEPTAEFAKKADIVKRCYRLSDSLLREHRDVAGKV